MSKLNPPPIRIQQVNEGIEKMNEEERNFLNEQKKELQVNELLIAEFTMLVTEYAYYGVEKKSMSWAYHKALNHTFGTPDL